VVRSHSIKKGRLLEGTGGLRRSDETGLAGGHRLLGVHDTPAARDFDAENLDLVVH